MTFKIMYFHKVKIGFKNELVHYKKLIQAKQCKHMALLIFQWPGGTVIWSFLGNHSSCCYRGKRAAAPFLGAIQCSMDIN